MVKYFCDGCGAELQETGRLSNSRALPNGMILAVEVMHIYEGVLNAGIFCKYCIIDTILPLDDRPRGTEC